MPPAPPPGPPVDEHHRYAGLVSRACALAVDVALVAATCAMVATLPPLAWRELVGGEANWLAAVCAFASAVLPWVYFTAAWWLGGRTAGALLLGLAVTRPDGGRLGVLRAALRSIVGLTFAPVWLVGLLWVLFDERRRAWHDLIFDTVVRYRAGGSGPDHRTHARGSVPI